MNRPVIIIEDDEDDIEIIRDAFENLPYTNPLIFFKDGLSALNYLRSYKHKPFLIISDINMPLMNGFELRDKIHADDDLRINCLPYIFMTTSHHPNHIVRAYSKSAQGYFVKPSSFHETQNMLKRIMEYWFSSKSPFNFLTAV